MRNQYSKGIYLCKWASATVYVHRAILYITVTLFRSLIHKFRLNLVVRCYRNSRHSQLFASLNYYREGGGEALMK